MTENKQLEIKIFGLEDGGGGDVRADVFVKKLSCLLKGLKAADQQSNGETTFEFFIRDLKYGSAYAALVEKPCNHKNHPEQSSIEKLHSVLISISDGRGIPSRGDRKIAAAIAGVCRDAQKTFSHAVIGIKEEASTVIRIDAFLNRKIERALKELASSDMIKTPFDGASYGTFDGELKEVDLRGTVASAKLILNIGGKELDCICNSVTVDNLRDALGQRVTVSALAHYNGKDRMPEQIDIKRIDILGKIDNLTKWRGAFDIPYPSHGDIW